MTRTKLNVQAAQSEEEANELEARVFERIDEIAALADRPSHELTRRFQALLSTVDDDQLDLGPILLRKLRMGPSNTYWVTTQLLEGAEAPPEVLLPVLADLLASVPLDDPARIPLISLAFRVEALEPLVRTGIVTLTELDALQQRSRRTALANLETNPFAAATLYDSAKDMPVEGIIAMLKELMAMEEPGIVPLLALWAEYPDVEVAQVAMNGLDARPSALTLALLPGLETHRERFETHRLMLEAQLRMAGMCPTFISFGPVHQALVGPVDGQGNSLVHLARRTKNDTISYVHILLDEQKGVADCIGGYLESEEDYGRLSESLAGDLLVPGDLALIQSRVEEALLVHRVVRRPCVPAFILWRTLLGLELEPGKRPIDLEPYGLSAARADFACLLEDSAALLELPAFAGWWPDGQDVYDFVTAHPPLICDHREENAMSEALLQRFVDRNWKLDRSRMARRVARMVEFLFCQAGGRATAGGVSTDVGRALAIWLALKEESLALGEIPFLRALARTSLVTVGRSLAAGERGPCASPPGTLKGPPGAHPLEGRGGSPV